MNDKRGRMQKEIVMSIHKTLPKNVTEELWKTVEHTSKNTWPLGQDLNLTPLEPKEGMLSTQQ
jgi:hypothetical protein